MRIDEVDSLESSASDTIPLLLAPQENRVNFKNRLEPARSDRDATGRFTKGHSGNPEGYSKSIKQRQEEIVRAYLKTFNELGGMDTLRRWANKSNANLKTFYEMILKILPKQIDTTGISNDNIVINWNKSAPTNQEGMGDAKKEGGGE